MRTLARLLHETSAASAAEFALVLPLLLILLFGIIDGGRFMWEYNRAEKATQMGARFAVVADPAASGFSDYSFAESDGVTPGAAVPTEDFDELTCDGSSASCSCTGGGVCDSVAYDSTAFGNIVARMAAMYPSIATTNVSVQYKNVGIGYAGDPNGSDVSPLVTVKLTGLAFHPITCLVFACSISMPDFRASLTGEDLSGTTSN